MPGWQCSQTKVMVAVDETCTTATAGAALRWTAHNLCDGQRTTSSSTHVCLVTVLPPPGLPSYPVNPILAGISQPYKPYKAPQRERDEPSATECLRSAAQLMVDLGARRDSIEGVVLDGVGGASGVADSIIQFAQKRRVDAVVMGARGMGAITRSLVNVLGLGSVSDYCIHNMHTPVIVVRADAHVGAIQAPRTVCLAYDDSPQAVFALTWALQHVLREGDALHVVTVAAPMPLPFVGEEPVSVAALEERQWQEAKAAALKDAQQLADQAGEMVIQMGWDGRTGRLVMQALEQKPGANEVALTIAGYAKEQQADLLVVGARGLGAFKRSVMSLVGLGSVSDYLVHNVTSCPVAVVKVQEQLERVPTVPGHVVV